MCNIDMDRARETEKTVLCACNTLIPTALGGG